VGVYMVNMSDEDELTKMATRRYYSHKKRCELINKTPPKKDDFIIKLIDNHRGGFKCSYCGKSLVLKQPYPYTNLPSIDHDVPLTMGGTSIIENLVVCCVACNIIKGTLRGSTYKKLLSAIGINSELFYLLFEESFNGKMANKLERLEDERHNKDAHVSVLSV
jgi:5-methylcytosine-specific restriction endonuclease McrA